MPVLSAKPLTDDPEGCSRLKSVISTDPGYDERARKVAGFGTGSLLDLHDADARVAACGRLTFVSTELAVAQPSRRVLAEPASYFAVPEPATAH